MTIYRLVTEQDGDRDRLAVRSERRGVEGTESSYGSILRVLGSTTRDFLNNLDTLHDHLQVSSYRIFCNIPDYIDGMVMYEYIAIVCNFKWSPPVRTTADKAIEKSEMISQIADCLGKLVNLFCHALYKHNL